jgi:hypothetical protein
MSAPQSLTTNNPNGVTNAALYQTMAQAGILDPTWAHVYHNDFDTYAAGDWTVTKVGTGTAALAAVDGGQLLLTTTAGAADAVYNQLTAASFKVGGGKDVFFKFSGILSEITNSVIYAGLIATSATPISAADGVFISKPTGSGALQLNVVVGGVSTVVAFPAACAIVAATAFELGFHIDYLGNVEAFFNPTTGADWQQLDPTSTSAGAMVTRGRVAAVANAAITNGLTTAVLNPSFGLLNSTAVARTLGCDYVTAVRNR